MYDARRIVRESAPLLAVLLVFQVAAGQVLHTWEGFFFAVPVLLLLVPAVNAVGGNVGSILGARIASGLHIGSISPDLRGAELWRNVVTALLLGVFTFAFTGLVVRGGSWLLGVEVGLAPGRLFLLLLVTGTLLTVSLVGVATFTALVAFRRGHDPDNVVVPVVTSLGDLLGILWLTVTYGVIT